jgi:hypothetical protein
VRRRTPWDEEKEEEGDEWDTEVHELDFSVRPHSWRDYEKGGEQEVGKGKEREREREREEEEDGETLLSGRTRADDDNDDDEDGEYESTTLPSRPLPPPNAVPVTPSLIHALNRVSAAQQLALSSSSSSSSPVPRAPRKEKSWDGWWAEVVTASESKR